jgi:hypothetical protein
MISKPPAQAASQSTRRSGLSVVRIKQACHWQAVAAAASLTECPRNILVTPGPGAVPVADRSVCGPGRRAGLRVLLALLPVWHFEYSTQGRAS